MYCTSLCNCSPRDTFAFTKTVLLSLAQFSSHLMEGISLCVVLGEDFKTVQKEVADILKGRILVGHALRNDLKVHGCRFVILKTRLQKVKTDYISNTSFWIRCIHLNS